MSLTIIAGTQGPQKATLTLDVDGTEVTKEMSGNGPVDAIFNAIHAIVPHSAKLSLYQVNAVTEGHRRAGRGVGTPRKRTASR